MTKEQTTTMIHIEEAMHITYETTCTKLKDILGELEDKRGDTLDLVADVYLLTALKTALLSAASIVCESNSTKTESSLL